MKKRLGVLLAASLGLWALASFPAHYMAGEAGLVFSAVAVVLCLVPTAATLAWSSRAVAQSPEQQLLAVLGGTGVRMTVVLGVGLALYTLVPYFHATSFWIWILVFYILTLATEVMVLAKDRPAAGGT